MTEGGTEIYQVFAEGAERGVVRNDDIGSDGGRRGQQFFGAAADFDLFPERLEHGPECNGIGGRRYRCGCRHGGGGACVASDIGATDAYVGVSATLAVTESETDMAVLTATGIRQKRVTLNIAGHTGNWYFKQTTPAGGLCSSVQTGSSATIGNRFTGLTGNTKYVFTAYSDAACQNEMDATDEFDDA